MRKIALLLCVFLLVSGCQKPTADMDSSPTPTPAGVGRNDPTPTPPPATQTPTAPPPTATTEAPTDTPTGTPSGEPTGEPSASPTDEAKGLVKAGMTAGEDYDFTQPVPETDPVSEDYFADAVFVGDSRTEGFRLYSGITQGDFLAHTGLMIFRIDTAKIKVDGEEMTVAEGLKRKDYGKVYVSLGVNELGMYDDQGYYDNYAAFIDQVREIQPEATIYVQLNIPVNSQKCKEKKQPYYVTNEQIDIYNGLLQQLCSDKQVFLLNPAEAIVDETGEPPYDVTADGVHFNKPGYAAWYEYLKTHTIDKGDQT